MLNLALHISMDQFGNVHATLVAIAGDTILVPYRPFKATDSLEDWLPTDQIHMHLIFMCCSDLNICTVIPAMEGMI